MSMDRQSALTERRFERPKLGMPNKGHGGKSKPKKPTHQDRLETNIGKTIFVSVKGELSEGELVEVDAFSVTIRQQDPRTTEAKTIDIVLFKHAIYGFWF